MLNIFKGSLKVFINYCAGLLIFTVFIFIVLNMVSENSLFWLIVYSFVIFIMTAGLIYGDLKRLAIKEKRPQYNMKPYPMKGLLLGIIGFFPFILLQLIYPYIVLNNEVGNTLKHLALNTLLGPIYGFIKLGGESVTAYTVASLTIPVVAMLGYMAGFYGVDVLMNIKKFFKKFKTEPTDIKIEK